MAGALLAAPLTAAMASPPHNSQAIGDLKARATAEDASAEYDLGSKYISGDDGLPKSPEASFCWIRRSAEHGFILSWLSLGMKYGMGEGVPKDDVESYKWFYLVQWLTPPNWPAEVKRDADEDAASMARRMTPLQIEASKQRARELWAKVVARGKPAPGQQYAPFPGDKPSCPTPGR
jgi:TPR repeat protein